MAFRAVRDTPAPPSRLFQDATLSLVPVLIPIRKDLHRPGGSSDADSARFTPGPHGAGAGAREGGARGGGWPRLQHCADFGETPSAGPGSSGGDLAQPATSGDDSVNQNGSPPPRHSRQARGMGVRSRLPSKSKLRRNTPPTVLPRLHRLPDLPLHSGTELQERPMPPPLGGAVTELQGCCPRQALKGRNL